MILSMTGFGRGICITPNKKIVTEIKSLNSKQLDLSMRMPQLYRELEVDSRNMVSEYLERGKVDMCVTAENLGGEVISIINIEALKEYKRQFEEMGRELNLSMPTDWYTLLMRMPEAMKTEIAGLDEEERKAFFKATEEALRMLVDFRLQEGAKLYRFFTKKIENIASLLEEIEKYEVERVPKIKLRLEEQLSRLSSIEYEPGRLEQELIFYIEKLDVNEEKQRLRSHLSYFVETLGPEMEDKSSFPKGQGKKLGFIAQEIGREINTLGSKSNHAEMQKIVVKMKDELEQIKEQVLNVL